ncbi:MAG: peptidase M20 [Desulfuromonadales bacterium GWD2_61_12]|nr:MAG: peptidase M20 [Desulfuromonadales bacterium GWC2_61_20]OGR35281.1 MAG: peptidase M20 [Desulfuromonadales bacterium GWD2_61_12]HBT83936.1 peptidase M20 [Desulfuromonas sp.]
MINVSRLCDEFTRLAAIASPSLAEGEIAVYLRRRLGELGATVVDDGAATRCGGEVGNLIARLPATGPGAPLLFSVHMDTVEPCVGVVPQLVDGVFTSAGETILGADDKAGIAELIEALEVVREAAIPHPPLEIVVTIAEEIGLVGAKSLDYSLIAARRGFALDTAGTDRLILTAPCANKIRVTLSGREAHAGIAPEKGISAIEVAARAIAAMRLGRIDSETTANIGTIHGGLATNIVARSVVLDGEARSHDPAKLEAQTRHMADCFSAAARQMTKEIDGSRVSAEIEVEIVSDYPRMSVAPDDPLVQLAQRAAARLGRAIELRPGGGGSDANIFNGHGIVTAILGTGMTDVHTVDESVSVADLVRVAELLVEIIREA